MSKIHSSKSLPNAETKGVSSVKNPSRKGYTTKPKCGAVTRGADITKGKVADGHPCLRVAGFGTDHLGQGRCKYHGGCVPRKHGLFSKMVPHAQLNSYEEALASGAEKQKDMTESLALLDGVTIPAILKRGTANIPFQPDPLELQLQAIDVKSKAVKRLRDAEQQSKISFTQSELRMLVVQIVGVVAEFVDAATLRKIALRIGTQTSTMTAQVN